MPGNNARRQLQKSGSLCSSRGRVHDHINGVLRKERETVRELCEKRAQESGLMAPQLTKEVLAQASFPLGERHLLFLLRTWPSCSVSVCSNPYPSLQDVLES